jgi:hypothetical protein
MKKLNVTINFDLDGTLADLYGVEGWLGMLENFDETPYAVAQPLLRLNTLARMLNSLQERGYQIAILSWLSKSGTEDYNKRVTAAKREWLARHLPSVVWDRIIIVKYGTPKENYRRGPLDILFDDEEQNRESWGGVAFDENDIIEILKTL